MAKSLLSDEEHAQLERELAALRDSRTLQTIYFYAAVGQSISIWADMEQTLVGILARLLRTTGAKAGLVGYSIINFYVWLQIIDDLFVLDGTYPRSLKKWRKLQESLKAENDIRARLAHHALRRDPFIETVLGWSEAELRPSPYDFRTKAKKFKPMNTKEILEFMQRVSALDLELLDLLKLMKKRKSLR